MNKEKVKMVNCEVPINTLIKIVKVGEGRFGYKKVKIQKAYAIVNKKGKIVTYKYGSMDIFATLKLPKFLKEKGEAIKKVSIIIEDEQRI